MISWQKDNQVKKVECIAWKVLAIGKLKMPTKGLKYIRNKQKL